MLCGTACEACPDRCYESLHTDDIHDPREIVSEHVQGHFGSNLWQASHQEVCAPIRILSVPNGCSTVSRRRRMACGFPSRRCCTASSTFSCSHRLMRRSGPVVHLDLREQLGHAVVQCLCRIYGIGKVPVQGRTTKDGVWLGPRVASGSERVASVLKNFRNYVANKDHQGWRLARSLDITLGHPFHPFSTLPWDD